MEQTEARRGGAHAAGDTHDEDREDGETVDCLCVDSFAFDSVEEDQRKNNSLLCDDEQEAGRMLGLLKEEAHKPHHEYSVRDGLEGLEELGSGGGELTSGF